MSTSGFFHGATLQNFLPWAMPSAQQTFKGTVSASPGQEAQTEGGQVCGRDWPCPLGTLPPASTKPGYLARRFVSKAGFSQETIWSPMAGTDRRQDVISGRSPGRTGDLQRGESQHPRGCQDIAQEVAEAPPWQWKCSIQAVLEKTTNKAPQKIIFKLTGSLYGLMFFLVYCLITINKWKWMTYASTYQYISVFRIVVMLRF